MHLLLLPGRQTPWATGSGEGARLDPRPLEGGRGRSPSPRPQPGLTTDLETNPTPATAPAPALHPDPARRPDPRRGPPARPRGCCQPRRDGVPGRAWPARLHNRPAGRPRCAGGGGGGGGGWGVCGGQLLARGAACSPARRCERVGAARCPRAFAWGRTRRGAPRLPLSAAVGQWDSACCPLLPATSAAVTRDKAAPGRGWAGGSRRSRRRWARPQLRLIGPTSNQTQGNRKPLSGLFSSPPSWPGALPSPLPTAPPGLSPCPQPRTPSFPLQVPGRAQEPPGTWRGSLAAGVPASAGRGSSGSHTKLRVRGQRQPRRNGQRSKLWWGSTGRKTLLTRCLSPPTLANWGNVGEPLDGPPGLLRLVGAGALWLEPCARPSPGRWRCPARASQLCQDLQPSDLRTEGLGLQGIYCVRAVTQWVGGWYPTANGTEGESESRVDLLLNKVNPSRSLCFTE